MIMDFCLRNSILYTKSGTDYRSGCRAEYQKSIVLVTSDTFYSNQMIFRNERTVIVEDGGETLKGISRWEENQEGF